ncbi:MULTISPECIES: hypothetical protein [Halomonadaceae]|uniref:hypothetical protein n=1 Tax=Halomonadaceae TaxID=28256 RepID=UPI0015983FEE|nr:MULTISPECIES: hypothetical protein [Halomonas]QJQ93916.1 hypothetical protein HIO72_00470 [Halomonas sp. PA5]
MSELNTAEMTREQLEATANDLGVKFQANTGDDTLRGRINEALGNPEPGPTKPDQEPAKPAAKAKAKQYKIIVSTHDQDKQPVQVGVNGRMYVIERGKEVTVPAAVVEVLRNAVQDIYDPKTMKKSHVSSYPFQVKGEA